MCKRLIPKCNIYIKKLYHPIQFSNKLLNLNKKNMNIKHYFFSKERHKSNNINDCTDEQRNIAPLRVLMS